MSLWPSRGLELHGVEIKVSRQDWLKELSDPAKADSIARYMDRWWLAIGDESIVQPGELPAPWGLLVFSGDKMVCKAEAARLTPEPLNRDFVAALLRRAGERLDAVRSEGFGDGYEKGQSAGPEEHQREMASVQLDLKRLRDAVDKFETDSGIKIGDWAFHNAGEVVREMLKSRGRYRREPSEIALSLARQLENAAKELRGDAKDYEREAKIATEFQLEPQLKAETANG
jgi:hypothetical protein